MTTRTATLRSAVLVACTALALAACNGSETSTQTAPIPTNAPDTTGAPEITGAPTTAEDVEETSVSTTAETSSTTTETSSTTPAETSTPPTTNVLESFGIPPAALETDPDSPNNNRIIKPEDEPIIAAYLEATAAQLVGFSIWPLDASRPVLTEAPFTPRVLQGFEAGAAERTAANQVRDISGGATSRPYVIDAGDEDPDRAIVWDCPIDATFYKDVDTGEKAPPDGGSRNAGPPGVEFGTSTALVRVDGEWLVDAGGFEERACS